MVIIMGDMNAKVRNSNNAFDGVIRNKGIGFREDNGGGLCESCQVNGYVITGTIFKHKNIHKATWTSPNGITKNQIDHILVNKSMRTSVLDTRAHRGADANSDHFLVRSKIRLKLCKFVNRSKVKPRLDINKLNDNHMRAKYNIEVQNRYNALEVECLEQWCEGLENAYVEAAEKTFGYTKRSCKPWISADTWSKAQERREIKGKVNSTHSVRIKERWKAQYRSKDREVKKSARNDKRKWYDKIAQDAQRAAENGRLKEVYLLTRKITGKWNRSSSAVKDSNGVIIKDKAARKARWKDHFSSILNRDDPLTPIAESDDRIVDEMDIDVGDITKTEVLEALKKTKNGKAPGADRVTVEMLKADINATVDRLTALFNKIWKEETTPNRWNSGLIIKVPKKGDLTDCNNWRGITLLPVISKIFGRILINRLTNGVDKVLRQEQAGFRPNRGTTEQIFTLRNILEQSNEWNASLYIHFIDFVKAFDSLHRNSLWNIMKEYQIPDKFIKIMKALYNNVECAVIDEGETTDWFEVTSGVKQGCVMSGFLFLLAIDWMMRKVTDGERRGIK